MEQKKYDVFISYSSKDSNTAFMLCEALENEGLTCWIAPRDVRAGHYATSIVEGIESSKLFVLLFSQNSNDSVPVLNELEMAMGNRLLIIPARIEEVLPSKAMKFYLMATHWFDILDAKSVDDFKGFVSVVKKNLGKNENRDTIHTVKPPKIVKKRSSYLKKIYPLIALIALGIGFFFWNKTPTDKNESLTTKKAEKSKVEILANKLISQTKEAQHWKEEYFKLKEKYKDYPQITVQAEKIQKREGYERAVSFYTNVKVNKIKKEISTPPKPKSNNKEKSSDTITTNLEPTTNISYIEGQVTDNMIVPIDEGAKPIDANKYRKKALIIENYNYVKLPKLQDKSSSLDKLKTTLEELGFDVTSKKNLNSKEFHKAIEKFSEELSEEPDTIGFIYYSGHGYQLKNESYLIPIDIRNKNEIAYSALNTKEMLESLSNAGNTLNMFFLDTFINIKKYLHSIPSNTLLMYSASGETTEDSTTFLDSLTKQIAKPMDIHLIANHISTEVAKITDNKQIPIIISNHTSPIFLNKPNKIFNLSSNKKLFIVVKNEITNQEKRVFCKGERLKIYIKDMEEIPYLVVLSLDKKGKVILLQPAPKNPRHLTFSIETEVTPPYGKDYLKFFALTNKEQYNKVLKLSKRFSKDGILNNIAIEELYQILLSDRDFKEETVQIKTIPMDKEQCYESVF